MRDLVAVILFFGITAYAVFGGADFGGGFWDLIAGGAEGGERPRALIDASITPVWEANHVWLIFVLVVLWTAFSRAFAAIMVTLFVPLMIAALGIVLRGASFAFRKSMFTTNERRAFGASFAASSVLVPYCFGAIAGGIASGRVPADGSGSTWSSWINPTSVLGGALAVSVCAYLAAVYLVWDARRVHDQSLAEYFRRRAVAIAMVTGAVALAGIFVLHADASYLFHGLLSRGLGFVAASVVFGLASLVQLVRGARFARELSVAAVIAIVVGWGVAQWPYMLPTTLKVSEAAAPTGTLAAVIFVFVVAAVVILPSLALLYVLDQRNALISESSAP